MKCKKGYKIKNGKCVSNKGFSKFFQHKFSRNLFGATIFGLASIFGWLVVQGFLSVFPRFSGIVAIIIGVIGLAIIGYFGYKEFK